MITWFNIGSISEGHKNQLKSIIKRLRGEIEFSNHPFAMMDSIMRCFGEQVSAIFRHVYAALIMEERRPPEMDSYLNRKIQQSLKNEFPNFPTPDSSDKEKSAFILKIYGSY